MYNHADVEYEISSHCHEVCSTDRLANQIPLLVGRSFERVRDCSPRLSSVRDNRLVNINEVPVRKRVYSAGRSVTPTLCLCPLVQGHESLISSLRRIKEGWETKHGEY